MFERVENNTIFSSRTHQIAAGRAMTPSTTRRAREGVIDALRRF